VKLPVVFDEYAMSMDPITVPLGPASIAFSSQSNFYQVLTIKGGDSGNIPKGATIYCSPKFARSKQQLQQLKETERKAIKDRFSVYLSLCFIDRDTDRYFDSVFVMGAKTGPDRLVRDIPPAPYRLNRDKPLAGNSYLKLVYAGGDLLSNASIDLQLYINGLKLTYYELSFTDSKIKAPNRWYVPIKAETLPQKINIGDAALTVTAINAETRSATISLDANMTRTPFQIEGVGSTMGIYYPIN
jgi:hypothetical protein